MKKFIYAVLITALLAIASEEIAVQTEPDIVMAAKKTSTKFKKQSAKKTRKKTKKKKRKKQSSQQQVADPDAGCIENPSDILVY